MAALRIFATATVLIIAAVAWLAGEGSACGHGAAKTNLALGDHAALESLLRADPTLVRSRDRNDQTLLHTAAALNDVIAARALLARGADVNARDQFGETPLHMAAMGSVQDDRVRMAALLLKAGARVNARDAGGRTPLHTAGIFLQKRLVIALRDAGADASLTDAEGRSPVDLATAAGMTWPAASNVTASHTRRDVMLAAGVQ